MYVVCFRTLFNVLFKLKLCDSVNVWSDSQKIISIPIQGSLLQLIFNKSENAEHSLQLHASCRWNGSIKQSQKMVHFLLCNRQQNNCLRASEGFLVYVEAVMGHQEPGKDRQTGWKHSTQRHEVDEVKKVYPSSKGKLQEMVNPEMLFLYSSSFIPFFLYMKSNWL